jgi:hypothetical protein
MGHENDIFVESDGTVHISHHDSRYDYRNLRYCEGTSGNWACQNVDTTGYAGRFSSIAVESDGTVHISHMRYATAPGTSYLRYCKKPSGGSWSCETIESGQYYGANSTIHVDAGGTVRISHKAKPRYCEGSAGNWSCEEIESKSTQDSTMFIDSNGIAHTAQNTTATTYYLRYCTAVVPEFPDFLLAAAALIAVGCFGVFYAEKKALSSGE